MTCANATPKFGKSACGVTKYLLDTTVLVDYMKGRRQVHDLLESLTEAGHEMGICCVNVAEVYAHLRPSEESRGEFLLSSLAYYEVTEGVARQAGRYQYDFARKGLTLGTPDAIVAATAQQEGAVLVTANVKDFSMDGLHLLEQP